MRRKEAAGMRNQVQLITYPDSMGGTLKELDLVLRRHFPGLFPGGVHILPPFPSSGDRGFAPLTYMEIEPRFGSWEDVRRIGESSDIILDLMVNHISGQSPYFQDFLKKGSRSRYAELFITREKLWPGGKPSEEDLSQVFLRRPSPFSRFTIADTGGEEVLWTTFGKEDPSEQIDMDWRSGAYRSLVTELMENFSRNGVKMVRLDAVGYVVKKIGTSCFFVEPETFDFLQWIRGLADSCGIELLPEVHANHRTQLRLSSRGYWIYDFILPYMILEALVNGNGATLRRYLANRPSRQFTMLDCHDGIPMKPDLDGLYDGARAKELVRTCVGRGANLSRVLSPRHTDPDGFDVHQICCTYYSALGSDDDAYLAARAIQFFAPGIPQVYYAGLLAGENDLDAVRRSGEGREINRHNYSVEEIDACARKDVVQRLVRLIRFRNEHPAFNGDFEVRDSEEHTLCLRWRKEESACTLTVDMKTGSSEIEHVDVGGVTAIYRI
jgi:sucrose phosphorylase